MAARYQGAAPAVPIVDVWSALGGGQLRGSRGRAFWREGNGWNVSLSLERGTWFDHAAAEGGGVIDLVVRARGGSRGEAFAWLAETFNLDTGELSPDARQRWARAQRQAVPVIAWRDRMVADWRGWHRFWLRVYHRARSLACQLGIDTPRGALLADVCEVAENRYLGYEARIDRIASMTPSDLHASYIRGRE